MQWLVDSIAVALQRLYRRAGMDPDQPRPSARRDADAEYLPMPEFGKAGIARRAEQRGARDRIEARTGAFSIR